MNVVPDQRVRRLADNLIRDAIKAESTGADAVLNHIDRLERIEGQMYALLGVLLTQIRINYRAGRPPQAVTLTEKQRKAAHAAYARGERDAITREGERQYQRAKKRAERRRG